MQHTSADIVMHLAHINEQKGLLVGTNVGTCIWQHSGSYSVKIYYPTASLFYHFKKYIPMHL